MDKLIKSFTAETKSSDDARRLVVKISTSTPDRSGDIVNPAGVILDNYLKNPVVALMHDYRGLPIAKAENITITDDSIYADVVFPDENVNPISDTVLRLYKGGFMNAWSIGFAPVEAEDRPEGGRVFKKWELWEFSAVLVPDNPEALTVLRSKGVELTDEAVKKEATVILEEVVEEVPATEDEAPVVVDEKVEEAAQEGAPVVEDEADEDEEDDDTVLMSLRAIRDELRVTDKNIGLFLKGLNQTISEKEL